jgi:hypothetical protein
VKEPPAAPRGGAGFDFGLTAAAAKEICENALHSWSPLGKGAYLCSGTPVDLGFSAEVVVHVCQGVVCSITVVHRPSRGWLKAYRDLKGQLESKFGNPASGAIGLPQSCGTDDILATCIDDELVNLHYTWTWPTGERLNLLLAKDNETKRAAGIRIQYVKPPTTLKANTDAL